MPPALLRNFVVSGGAFADSGHFMAPRCIPTPARGLAPKRWGRAPRATQVRWLSPASGSLLQRCSLHRTYVGVADSAQKHLLVTGSARLRRWGRRPTANVPGAALPSPG